MTVVGVKSFPLMGKVLRFTYGLELHRWKRVHKWHRCESDVFLEEKHYCKSWDRKENFKDGLGFRKPKISDNKMVMG